MMPGPLPLTKELVLIGGGHAHALVLRSWGMAPLPGVRLTLISPGPTAPYSGMLPGHIAGHYSRDDLMIDLVQLARFAGARLIDAAVSGLDPAARLVLVAGRPPVPYDIASINIGIASHPSGLPGFAEHAIAVKPLGPYADRWQRFRADVAADRAAPRVAVIGAGIGGVELSLAMAHALRADGHAPQVTLIDQAAALPGLGASTRQTLLRNMDQQGVRLAEHAAPIAVGAGSVTLQSGTEIAADLTVGIAGARPQGWLQNTGLALQDGFIKVDAELQSSDPSIFAVGDCAALPSPRAKAGVYAVRQAPVLGRNLRADLTGTSRRGYRPQRDYLKLISLGGKSAVVEKYGGRLLGRWLWRLKNRIDLRFMAKFAELPHMPSPVLPRETAFGVAETLGDKPQCGGCGSKIGGDALTQALAALPEPTRADIVSAPGDDAAILLTGGTRQVLTTDHLRAFTEDPFVMARIAAVHAMGDIWAMGATPQAALATVILPRMAEPMQRAWLAEIMAAAAGVFVAEGADIVGGHSSSGAELTLGFSVSGLLDGAPVTLAGAQPGDRLILTKPIGSGTILAGEMTRQARGDHVMQALEIMARPQGAAARILGRAHAMTDVTGFGLAGHCLNICRASGVGARLDLASIRVMAGAEDLAARGIRSTLYPENRRIAAAMQLPDSPRADLLFDPQTAGGLLAAVAPQEADRSLAALGDAGIDAAEIGCIEEGPPFIRVR